MSEEERNGIPTLSVRLTKKDHEDLKSLNLHLSRAEQTLFKNSDVFRRLLSFAKENNMNDWNIIEQENDCNMMSDNESTEKTRITVYLDEETEDMFNEIYVRNIQEKTGLNKSDVVCMAIQELYKKLGCESVRFSLRIGKDLVDRIDYHISKEGSGLSRNAWILQAAIQKVEEEEKKTI